MEAKKPFILSLTAILAMIILFVGGLCFLVPSLVYLKLCLDIHYIPELSIIWKFMLKFIVGIVCMIGVAILWKRFDISSVSVA